MGAPSPNQRPGGPQPTSQQLSTFVALGTVPPGYTAAQMNAWATYLFDQSAVGQAQGFNASHPPASAGTPSTATPLPTIDPIFNDLTSAALSVIAATDPETIKFYRDTIADQINAQRKSQSPPKECIDLSDHIGNIQIETTVQGAGMLEVHIIDPAWALLTRDTNGTAFFDVDDQGYLWPPIDLNFPANTTDAWWRLCQLRPSTDLTQANIIAVFEDRVAAVLREFQGPVQSSPNETRAEFIQRLIKEARTGGSLPAIAGTSPTIPKDQTDGLIRFIPLLPHSDFTTADLTQKPPTSNSNGRTNWQKIGQVVKAGASYTVSALEAISIVDQATTAMGVSPAHYTGSVPPGPPTKAELQHQAAPHSHLPR